MSGVRASHHLSPLRYPGGKGKLAQVMKRLMLDNQMLDRIYVEPFAGGAGVALALLMHGYVRRIIINDLNPPIYAFWQSILQRTDDFCTKVADVELTPTEWSRQKTILHSEQASELDLGFAAFFLNRTNHSGVLNGGMIGGKAQDSKYKINARFNKSELIGRIMRVKRYADKIEVSNLDAIDLIKGLQKTERPTDYLIYADPPYVNKGPDLYYSFFRENDHCELANEIFRLAPGMAWAVSYDDAPLVSSLYGSYQRAEYTLGYSVRNGGSGREVMFFSDCFRTLTAFEAKEESQNSLCHSE